VALGPATGRHPLLVAGDGGGQVALLIVLTPDHGGVQTPLVGSTPETTAMTLNWKASRILACTTESTAYGSLTC